MGQEALDMAKRSDIERLTSGSSHLAQDFLAIRAAPDLEDQQTSTKYYNPHSPIKFGGCPTLGSPAICNLVRGTKRRQKSDWKRGRREADNHGGRNFPDRTIGGMRPSMPKSWSQATTPLLILLAERPLAVRIHPVLLLLFVRN